MTQGTNLSPVRPISLSGWPDTRSIRPSRIGEVTMRSRLTELLILCARIGFNP
jgi:hypothetical protein